ncbi:MAG: transcriptional repressor [Bacteroidia bacterium]|nr:transcriptional repressor [Bacteroidia bacterium]
MLETKADNKEIFEQVKSILDNYLKEKKLRRTLERYYVLKEIYSINDHFEIDELYERMKNKKYRVSRATLYNNMEIFVDAGLVIKHQFGTHSAQYERAYNYRQHDHLICSDCGKVFEFCDPRIIQIQKTTENLLGFHITQHSLQFTGKCQAFAQSGKCENKKTN